MVYIRNAAEVFADFRVVILKSLGVDIFDGKFCGLQVAFQGSFEHISLGISSQSVLIDFLSVANATQKTFQVQKNTI